MSIRNNRWSVRNQERTLKIGVAGAYFIKRDVINRHGLIPAVQYQRKFIIPQIDCPQEDVDNAFAVVRGFPKGAQPHLAHDFAIAKSSVLCLPATRREIVYYTPLKLYI